MRYTGEYTREISFPIGGIGTGSFGIAGNGSFIDWEIFNKPAKGRILGYSHIAVKAKTKDGTVVRILNGDLQKDLTGTYDKGYFHGFGYGPQTGTMCGMAHFRDCVFDGEFPIARLTFTDPDFPGEVVMTVFNPFIPLDAYNSSIPAGFFRIDFRNTTEEEVEYTAVFSMLNPFADSINEAYRWEAETGKEDASPADRSAVSVMKLTGSAARDSVEYGDLSVSTDCAKVQIQRYWLRGKWSDGLDVFINELRNHDRFIDRVYDTPGSQDVASMAAAVSVQPGNREQIRFVLSWNVPNNYNYWTEDEDRSWKNYYATVFEDSVESGRYCLDHFDSLLQRTENFRDILHGSSLDSAVIDAASSTISVLKSPTVLRLEDGSFYGWEGVHEQAGSCEGTCQHVWNYAYALCFLFPELERSIRDNEFTYCTCEDGRTAFRMGLPRDRKKFDHRACLDGQMGTVIKTYREWKISGDSAWLEKVWPTVKHILAYAWSEENPDKWDRNQDGVLEGRQHHTLDMELFGPSAWLQGFYLGALKAAWEMADFLGDREASAEYARLFAKGYAWTEENLFNGSYYIQKVDLADKAICDAFDCVGDYWYDEGKQLKYQIGDGCVIDQLLGQWHANLCGLGDLFDKEHRKVALQNLYKYNFKASLREHFNTWRVFSLNDEGGAVICTFPGKQPVIPIPYHAETMTGFEYALAGLLISEGFEEEGLTIVRAIRDRYDGRKRNPWNEIECGSNYARAMASFALLPVYSGFTFDLPHNRLGFDPIHKEHFRCLYSVGTGWGEMCWEEDAVTVQVQEGYLELRQFDVKAAAKGVEIDGVPVEYITDGQKVCFDLQRVEKSLKILL